MLIKFYMYHHRGDEEKFRQRTSSVCTVLITLKQLVAVIPPKYKGEHNYSDQLSLLFWVRVRIYKNKNYKFYKYLFRKLMAEEVQETTWLIRNMGSLISELLQQNINKITHAKINGRATVMNIIMY